MSPVGIRISGLAIASNSNISSQSKIELSTMTLYDRVVSRCYSIFSDLTVSSISKPRAWGMRREPVL